MRWSAGCSRRIWLSRGDQRGEAVGPSRSHCLSWYFSESRYSSRSRAQRLVLHSSKPAVDAAVGDERRGEHEARVMNIARPPVWSCSVRMSGVFGQKLGRKKSADARPARSMYSTQLPRRVFRQVK